MLIYFFVAKCNIREEVAKHLLCVACQSDLLEKKIDPEGINDNQINNDCGEE